MDTAHTSRRRGRMVTAIGAAALVVVGLAACSQGGNGADGSGSSPKATSGQSTLTKQVDALTKPLDSLPVPTEAVKDVASVKGGTVYYIPITARAPQFATTQAGLKAAAKVVGVKVQVCDGQGTPTGISSCVTQATQAKATGIILDGMPYDIAANAITAARDKGIPVVMSNAIKEAKYPESSNFAYVGTAGTPQLLSLVKWITLDSGGTANVLFNRSTDGPGQKAYVAAAVKSLASVCPKCKATVYDVSSAGFAQIPSQTSSALLKNPNVNYVVSEFAEYLSPTQQGIQQAGATSKVKVTTAASALSTLKLLKTGNSIVAATAQAAGYQGWVDLDGILRLVAGQQVPAYTIPTRLFTKDSIASVTLTTQAETSGEWFGPTSYTNDFKKIWGVE